MQVRIARQALINIADVLTDHFFGIAVMIKNKNKAPLILLIFLGKLVSHPFSAYVSEKAAVLRHCRHYA